MQVPQNYKEIGIGYYEGQLGVTRTLEDHFYGGPDCDDINGESIVSGRPSTRFQLNTGKGLNDTNFNIRN